MKDSIHFLAVYFIAIGIVKLIIGIALSIKYGEK